MASTGTILIHQKREKTLPAEYNLKRKSGSAVWREWRYNVVRREDAGGISL